jgi:hypothetical protein
MIKNNEKTLDDTVVININNGMSQPTYSNNKEDVLKNLKKNIRVCSGTAKAKRWNGLFLLICLENQNGKNQILLGYRGLAK